MKEFVLEIIKFFKNNLVKLIIGTLLIALPYIWLNSRTSGENIETIDGVATFNENQEIKVIETVANPASFTFFAEHLDGYPFSNNAILAQYIITPDILTDVEQATGTNINELIQNTENKIFVTSEETTQTTEMKILGVSKSPNEHLHELYVNIGNEEDNLAIATYFYEAIINDNIPILSDKIVYMFQAPHMLEVGDNETLEISEETEIKTTPPFGADIIVGLSLGVIVTLAILLIQAFFSKKLHYLFTYSIREKDSFVVVDKNLESEEEIDFLISSSSDSENVVLMEREGRVSNGALNSHLTELVNTNKIRTVNNVFEIEDYSKIGRLIYIIEEGQTNRSWYNKQRKYDDFYNLPTVLVQINKNKQNIEK